MRAKKIRSFFFSQDVADGIRMTVSIVLPVFVLDPLGFLPEALTLSLEALCTSLTDTPGPGNLRRNFMLICTILTALVSFLTMAASLSAFVLFPGVLLMVFIFSMLSVYGVRAASVGSACLLVMVLSMDPAERTFAEMATSSALILAGGLWYTALSTGLSLARPYRMAQRQLGEYIIGTADFLWHKADFFDLGTDLESDYQQLFARHIKVTEQQDALRELLYRTRQIVGDTTGTGRTLMLTFVDTVDLFSLLNTSLYDYHLIRNKFAKQPALRQLSVLMKNMADELSAIGLAIQRNSKDMEYRGPSDEQFESIRTTLRTVDEGDALMQILDNLQQIQRLSRRLSRYLAGDFSGETATRKIHHTQYIQKQEFPFRTFVLNLSFRSTIFRHATRVTVAALAGIAASHYLDLGEHAHWVLMTIVFIMKPAFSLTRARNIQRLAGTAAGVTLTAVLLYLIASPAILLFLLLFLMTVSHVFARINYITMVISTTAYVLIMLQLLGHEYPMLIEERVVDTGLGCLIAIVASYTLWPSWEGFTITRLVRAAMEAHRMFIRKLMLAALSRNAEPRFRLARRELNIQSANLAAAFQRMLSEPPGKQKNASVIYEFVVLNHTLTSNVNVLAEKILKAKTILEVESELMQLHDLLAQIENCLRRNAKEPWGDENFLLKVGRDYCRTAAAAAG